MSKSPEMLQVCKDLSPNPEAWEQGKNNTCAICGGAATVFDDLLSRKEYEISRMCQQCQDGIFGRQDR